MRRRSVSALVLCLLLCSVLAKAESYAVVVGIREYEKFHPEKPLQFPDRDAESFSNFLKTKAGGSFSTANLKLLPNGKATRANILAAIEEIARKAVKPEDVVYFYFTGHGAQDALGKSYLVPYDVDPDLLADKGWEGGEFLRLLETKISAGHLILFIDSCYAGALSGAPAGASSVAQGDLQALWAQTFKESEATHFAFSAARSDQSSWESEILDGGHGVFTHYLLQGLEGQADLVPYGNRDGVVQSGELYKFVSDKVAGFTKVNFEVQAPTVSEGYDRNFPLASPGGAHPLAVKESAGPPPAWEGPIFPLLPDPPEDTWANNFQGEEAREYLVKAKGLIERADSICSDPPSFSWLSRPDSLRDPESENDDKDWSKSVDERRVYLQIRSRQPNLADLGASAAFSAADHSLTIEENPWARFYRGLALARLRAFTFAAADLDRASEAFRARGLKRYADVASRMRILVGEWERAPAQESPSSDERPGCAAESGRTTCEVATRAHWSSLSVGEKRALVDRFKALLDKPVCRADGNCVPLTPEADLHCASSLAKAADAGFAAEVRAAALEHALRNGMAVEAEEQAEGLALALLEAGRSAEADGVLRQRRNLWSPYQKSWIALRAAVEPSLPAGELATKLTLLEIEPALRADLMAIDEDVRRIRGRLSSIGPAIEDAFSLNGDPARAESIDHAGDVERLSANLRAALGKENFEGLRPLIDQFVTTLKRIAAHIDGPVQLGSLCAELDQSLGDLGATLHDSPHYEDYREPGDLALAVAIFASYDVALRGRSQSDWALGLGSILAGEAPPQIQIAPYVVSVGFAHATIDTLIGEKGMASLKRSLELRKDSSDSDSFLKMFGELSACFEKASDPRNFASCGRRGMWTFFESLRTDESNGLFVPLAEAHRLAKREALAKVGGVPTNEESWTLYQQSLIEKLIEGYSTARPGELTQAQRDFLPLFIPMASLVFEEGAPSVERFAEAQKDDSEASDVPSELLSVLRLWSSDDKTTVEARSKQARETLSGMRHPFFRAIVLAVPVTYAGLPADEIRSLVELSGLKASKGGAGLLEAALSMALLLDDEGVLHYEQQAALAAFLLKNESGVDFLVDIPVGPEFLPFAADVSPLVFTSTCRNPGLEPGFKVNDLEGVQVEVSCSCCTWSAHIVRTLLEKAIAESLWSEASRWFSWLETQQVLHPELDFGCVDAASSLVVEDKAVPDELRRAALAELQSSLQKSDLALDLRLEATAALATAYAESPEKETGIARSTLRDLMVSISAKISQGSIDAGGGSFDSWFMYLDAVGKAFKGMQDPELVFLWKRQMGKVRGRLAAPSAAAPGESPEEKEIQELEGEAAKGDARALTHLGWIRSHTVGPARDAEKALAELKQAAALEDPEAMQLLASLLPPGSKTENGLDAFGWLEKSAALGNSDALVDFGRRLAGGRGIKRDPVAAFHRFQKAADQGNVDAMNELGICFAMGEGTPPDPAAAATWFKRAADLGHPAAGSNLNALQ